MYGRALIASLALLFLSAIALADDGGTPTVEDLIATLKGDGGSRERADAAEALARRSTEAIVPALRQAAKDERDFHVRLAIHYALAAQGEKSALRVLLDSLDEQGHLGYVYLTRVAGVDYGWNVDGSSKPRWEAWYAALEADAFRRQARRKRLPKRVLDGGWDTFLQAVTLLQEEGDRPKVTALLEKLMKEHPDSDHALAAADLVPHLRQQIEEDKAWRGSKRPPSKHSSLKRRLAYAVHHLRNVNARQRGQPGMCDVTRAPLARTMKEIKKKKPYNAAIALLEIGQPAIPTLLRLLEDRRPTRSVGYWRDYDHSRTVLRYQDVAIQVLNRILPAAPYRRSSTGAYLSNEDPAARKEIIDRVRAWAEKTKGKSELEVRWLSVEYAPIYSALKLVKRLAREKGQKKRALATLHEMWEQRHWIFQPHIATSLAELGDTSKVKEVIENHRKNKYGSHMIQHPDDSAASINASQAAAALERKYGAEHPRRSPGASED